MTIAELPRADAARRWQVDAEDGRHFVALWSTGDMICSCDEPGCVHKRAVRVLLDAVPNVRCAWCGLELRHDPLLPYGTVSHGMCAPCAAAFDAEVTA